MRVQQVIPHIIERHAEDAAFIWLLRDAATDQPHYNLTDLIELDARLDANLDGLRIAGEFGWQVALDQLAFGEPGEVFVAGWLAVDGLDGRKLDLVMSRMGKAPDNYRALVAAIAWHPLAHTAELIDTFLRANNHEYVALGIHLCGLHRRDPGAVLDAALQLQHDGHLARVLRTVGQLKRRDLLNKVKVHTDNQFEPVAFWAMWSALLLGERSVMDGLRQHVLRSSGFAQIALQLLARTLDAASLTRLLQSLARDRSGIRLAMQGAGWSGDPFWIPGLLKYMEDPQLARVCGESFSLITGLDLAYEDLDEDAPDCLATGPTEDASDDRVELDADQDLPWPDRQRLYGWWASNSGQFKSGTRYLCGMPLTQTVCCGVLMTGYQRQRQAAALELAVMGHTLFETRARGDLQKTLLAANMPSTEVASTAYQFDNQQGRPSV